jgi:glutamyl-tRNA reductase
LRILAVAPCCRDAQPLRAAAAVQAEEIVNLHAQGFLDWLQSLDGNATIVRYREQAEAVRDELLQKAQARLAKGEDAAAVLKSLAHGLTNRLTHSPTAKIREASIEGRQELVLAARELLGLDHAGDPE